MKIQTVLRVSKNDNLYMALTAYNEYGKLYSVCLFENKPFVKYSKLLTDGQRDLPQVWEGCTLRNKADLENVDESLHTEKLTKIGGIEIAFTKTKTICGRPVAKNGAYLLAAFGAYYISESEMMNTEREATPVIEDDFEYVDINMSDSYANI